MVKSPDFDPEGFGNVTDRGVVMKMLTYVLASSLLVLALGAVGEINASGSAGTLSLKFDPPSLSVERGETAWTKITITPASGQSGKVNLKSTGVPGALSTTFNPTVGDPPFTSTMAVHAAVTAGVGTYTIKIQAAGDAPSDGIPYQVTVTKGAKEY